MMRRPLLAFGLYLVTSGCSSPSFAPFERCEVDCPLPPTVGPVANWVFPGPGAPVRATDVLHVTAVDDLGIAHVEIYWEGLKVHAGVIAGAPYTAPWLGLPTITVNYTDGDPVNFMAIATDMEGNADTVFVTAQFEADP